MKLVAKKDGTLTIDLANTLLLTRGTAVETVGDVSNITVVGGHFLMCSRHLRWRLRHCWYAVRWIWNAPNQPVSDGKEPR